MSFFARFPVGNIRAADMGLCSGRIEVAVIDTSLADWAILRDGLKAGTEVVLIDGHEDGLLALAQALQGRTGIDALHVLSHGFAGGFLLGSAKLDASTLGRYTPALRAIGASLADEADILLYSCWTARGAGPALLSALSAITGANVAASYTLTGAASQGGDWTLGYRSGRIASGVALTDAAMQGYQHTLPGIQPSGPPGPPGPLPPPDPLPPPPPPSPPPVTIALANDTGSSTNDHITNDPMLSGGGDAGAFVVLTEGGTPLGTVLASSSGAWTFTPTLSDGPHTITASETGSSGNGSATLTFNLYTTLPVDTVALAQDTGSSSSDGITSNAALTGTGQANTVVTITEGTATVLGSTTVNGSGVWTFTPTLLDGSYTLFAHDEDIAGNIGTQSVSVTLSTAAPSVPAGLGLAAGSDGGALGDGLTNVTTPTLHGTGVTGDSVTLYDGGVAIGTATVSNGTWSVTPGVALTVGNHSLTAKQTDAAGNVSAASAVMPLVIDTTLPAATSGIAPAAGSGVIAGGVTSATSLAIGGTGVVGDTVKVYDGTTLLGSTTVASGGAWSFTAGPLADGAHSLTTTQSSPAGSVSAASAAFALTVDTVAPNTTTMLAANPHNTASMTYNQVLSGGGDPNASVTIREGSVVVGAATADATGAWSFDLAGLAAGSHSLIASETDAAGNIGASAAVALTVAPSVVADTRFTIATGSAATSGSFFGSDYTGAAPGHLQAQYGYVGTANVSVVANVANTFIYGGGGNDAIVAKAGSNVLDGAGGSNWMVGASGADGGTDTFFVDNRSSQTTWNTLLNFHVGDMLTVWGYNPAAGSVNFADNLGQPGYTGMTLKAGLGTGVTDLATFAGLSSGATHLVTSTGTSGGLSYLAVTRVA